MTNFMVGWNIPGYLPDADDPYVYATFDEAKAGIIDELHRAADDYGDEDEALRTPYELAIAEFEAAAEPRTVMVGDYAWWIEPTDEPVSN